MSGHSKWSTIKRQKQSTDQVRGQLFTKLANSITIAVREGGGITDPAQNIRLRMVVEKAKAANMPKDNIARAIDRASRKESGENLEEILYEGFGPHGIAILASGVTDNKQRTISAVKNIISTNGGTLAGAGSVSYLFEKSGEIIIEKGSLAAENVLGIILSSDADDFTENETEFIIYTKPNDLNRVREYLEKKKIPIVKSELIFKPLINLDIAIEKREKVIKLIDALENQDDIHRVFTNMK